MDGTEALLLLGFVFLISIIYLFKESGLKDPNNTRFIPVETMRTSQQLRPGRVSARLMRQSGGEYRYLGDFDSADAALSAVMSAFRRAQIDSVSVMTNTPERYEVIRLHHSHGGKAEGKKLGGAVLIAV